MERVPRPGLAVASQGDWVVMLETQLSPDLVTEGLARELVNRVQGLRKTADFEVSQRIRVVCHGDAAVPDRLNAGRQLKRRRRGRPTRAAEDGARVPRQMNRISRARERDAAMSAAAMIRVEYRLLHRGDLAAMQFKYFFDFLRVVVGAGQGGRGDRLRDAGAVRLSGSGKP